MRRRALRPATKETALRLQRLFGPGLLNRVALKPSSYFLSAAAKVTTYARTLCLKLRYNATFAGWKRYKCRQAASPNCELCGAFDHDFHTVADCTHPMINRMNTRDAPQGNSIGERLFPRPPPHRDSNLRPSPASNRASRSWRRSAAWFGAEPGLRPCRTCADSPLDRRLAFPARLARSRRRLRRRSPRLRRASRRATGRHSICQDVSTSFTGRRARRGRRAQRRRNEK